ncbi:MAG TPA: hypothetical protein H9796_13160 [Candidatus Butyricimonas faecavium]|nr:hypothetical protein [Candidatus Butyricimonas faecavium]
MSAPNIPIRIMMFRDFVPDRVRVLLCLFFALTFQFSGGIYLASVSQMVGSLSLMQEDIMMAGYASFVGMTVIFPILFRLKFRFTSRAILLVVCPVLIVCNLITMRTGSLPVLVGVCFIAGMFRILGTFECLSSVQLSITPTRNFAVFFPVVYLVVLGSIQLSGLATVYLGYWANWRYMHWFIIGLLFIVWLCTTLFTRHFRFMKALPLYGIDWLGGVLWAIFLLSLVFVFEYGKFYDWLYSPYIRSGIVVAVVSLLLNINRMYTLRHPYITKEALSYRNLGAILLAFLVLCGLQTTPTILQNIFTGSILKYDVLNSISLNWWNLLGIILGTLAVYYWHARLHGGYKRAVFTGFGLIVIYQCCMYFLIDPRMNIEWLYLPTLLRGAGYVMIYISLTVYISGFVPFQHFFQVLSLLGFVRTGFGSALGSAIYERVMQHVLPGNYQLLAADLDAVNPIAAHIPTGQLYGETMRQVMLVSVKELYGWTCIIGVFFLLMILSYRYLNRNTVGRLPGMRQIKRIMKRDTSFC